MILVVRYIPVFCMEGDMIRVWCEHLFLLDSNQLA